MSEITPASEQPPPLPQTDAPLPPAAASVNAGGVACLRCGYDLTGATIGGQCPECGTPVTMSFQSAATAPPSGKAITALILGIVSIPLCMCYGVPSLICGGMALMFAELARRELLQRGENPYRNGMLIAGAICGGVGLLLGAAVTLYMAGVFIWIAVAQP